MYPGNYIEFYSDLTKEIDTYLNDYYKNYNKSDKNSFKFRSYLLLDKKSIEEHRVYIRVPGCTIGCVYYTGKYPNDMIITKVIIDNDLVVLNWWFNNDIKGKSFSEFINKPLVLINK